ncbi:MAG: prepilin-type N-terminal cleavage/methylation domain-containing protein [Bryobacteraceae bacterium]
MLTSSAGARNRRERGITLLELLIVVALIALLTGMSYAPVAAGLETLRLRAASDLVLSFLSSSLDRAERKQAVVEVQILPVDNVLLARTSDRAFQKRVDLPEGMKIARITPEIPSADPRAVRRFLIYPGGAVPQVSIELVNSRGRRRIVSLDPLTGIAQAVEVMQ